MCNGETSLKQTVWQFKILYDGECPFCKIEVNWLSRRNREGKLKIEDISAPDFDPTLYGSTLPKLMGTLHGVYPDGRLTTGMDTFRNAYRAVGLGWLLAPTGWRLLRPVFDRFYELFAANRVKAGRRFGRTCESDRCKM